MEDPIWARRSALDDLLDLDRELRLLEHLLVLLGRQIVIARCRQADGVLEPLVRYGPGGVPSAAF